MSGLNPIAQEMYNKAVKEAKHPHPPHALCCALFAGARSVCRAPDQNGSFIQAGHPQPHQVPGHPSEGSVQEKPLPTEHGKRHPSLHVVQVVNEKQYFRVYEVSWCI